MALLAAGSLGNVYQSLDAYVQTMLVQNAGLAIHMHGVRRFLPPVDDPWVQVHYDFLGLQGAYRHYIGGANIYAREPQGYLQLNIYQRARIWAQRYVTSTARDMVVSAFPEGTLIPILDYSDVLPDMTPATIGYIVLDGLQEHVQDLGLRSGVTQHILQISTRYLEQYTK